MKIFSVRYVKAIPAGKDLLKGVYEKEYWLFRIN
jgi:hypothetical protein